ncbi:MAG: hypothetical protein JNJ49_08150 [Bdellovibrionaceae bacterium]|nr:hypothetical protein [Pseudobdellovibrionaceae bacterium]
MTNEQSAIEGKLIELLEEKNHYLAKFVELNETELLNFEEGYFENVESFYQAREKVLDIVRCIDALIDDEVRALGETAEEFSLNAETRACVEDLMRTKDVLAKQILAQDLKVLAAIENEKSNIIRDLQQTTQSRKAVGAYGASAAQADLRQLDEEA